MSIAVVYAVGTEYVDTPGGGRVRVQKGTHWPADDPAVRLRPELFSDDPRWGMFYSVEPAGYDAPIGGPVESASAAPGERRNTRRAG